MKSAISAYLASIGSKGGKTTGKSKARTPAQSRKAALAMWAKRRANARKGSPSGTASV